MFPKLISILVTATFASSLIGPLPHAWAQPRLPSGQQGGQALLGLPEPGTMVNLSAAYQPPLIKGVTVNKDNPFRFDFIVSPGQDRLAGDDLKKESEKLIKYFLASLTLPEKDVWVNLSPYEQDRTLPETLSHTEMGRDLLAQDYILKQITASLIYPEKELGKTFWDKVYTKAREQFGTAEIPVNTFNKVWIMADKAEVFERNQTAFVVDSHLKVMLEEDYLALKKNSATQSNSVASQIVKDIILPELEREVNQGKNFANLRQIFNSIILASWYKNTLKQALLNQIYADKKKVKGIALEDTAVKEQIYQRYLQAYKKGVFNYIKEDTPGPAGTSTPRKYFSGGIDQAMAARPVVLKAPDETVQQVLAGLADEGAVSVGTDLTPKSFDPAMLNDVVITGATGFLGDSLVKAVGDPANANALVLNDRESGLLRKSSPRMPQIVGTLVDVNEVKGLFRGRRSGTFINLAADTRTGIKQGQQKEAAEILTTNVLGAAVALLAAHNEAPGMRKIFISSFDVTTVPADPWVEQKVEEISQYAVEYYNGKASKTPQEFFAEIARDYAGQAFKVDPYRLSKALMDKILVTLAAEFQIKEVLVLRIMGPIGMGMGRSQAFGLTMKLIDAVKAAKEGLAWSGGPVTPFKGLTSSLISVDDIVRVFNDLSTVKLSPEQAATPIFLELGGERIALERIVDIVVSTARTSGITDEQLRSNIKFQDPPAWYVNVEAQADLGPLEQLLGKKIQMTPLEQAIAGIARTVFDSDAAMTAPQIGVSPAMVDINGSRFNAGRVVDVLQHFLTGAKDVPPYFKEAKALKYMEIVEAIEGLLRLAADRTQWLTEFREEIGTATQQGADREWKLGAVKILAQRVSIKQPEDGSEVPLDFAAVDKIVDTLLAQMRGRSTAPVAPAVFQTPAYQAVAQLIAAKNFGTTLPSGELQIRDGYKVNVRGELERLERHLHMAHFEGDNIFKDPAMLSKVSVRDLEDLNGEIVVVREGYDVTLANGKLADPNDPRIVESFATIRELMAKGAKIVLMSHMGRPKGKDPRLSLAPVAQRLKEEFGEAFKDFNPEFDTLKEAKDFVNTMKPGEILLLENLRFNSGEEKNVRAFAEEIFEGAYAYVNDAPSVMHRAHASIVGMTKGMPRVMGLLMEKEIDALEQSRQAKLAVMGGSKVADKITVIKAFLDGDPTRRVLIGGAMANAFLKAAGKPVGSSRGAEDENVAIATELLARYEKRIVLPVDFITVDNFENPQSSKTVSFEEGAAGTDVIVDIGPKTAEIYAQEIGRSELTFWNGPVGAYDRPSLAEYAQQGTATVALAIAGAGQKAAIGGGDSVTAFNKLVSEDIRQSSGVKIATGGGASLEYLEGKKLPGIAALSPSLEYIQDRISAYGFIPNIEAAALTVRHYLEGYLSRTAAVEDLIEKAGITKDTPSQEKNVRAVIRKTINRMLEGIEQDRALIAEDLTSEFETLTAPIVLNTSRNAGPLDIYHFIATKDTTADEVKSLLIDRGMPPDTEVRQGDSDTRWPLITGNIRAGAEIAFFIAHVDERAPMSFEDSESVRIAQAIIQLQSDVPGYDIFRGNELGVGAATDIIRIYKDIENAVLPLSVISGRKLSIDKARDYIERVRAIADAAMSALPIQLTPAQVFIGGMRYEAAQVDRILQHLLESPEEPLEPHFEPIAKVINAQAPAIESETRQEWLEELRDIIHKVQEERVGGSFGSIRIYAPRILMRGNTDEGWHALWRSVNDRLLRNIIEMLERDVRRGFLGPFVDGAQTFGLLAELIRNEKLGQNQPAGKLTVFPGKESEVLLLLDRIKQFTIPHQDDQSLKQMAFGSALYFAKNHQNFSNKQVAEAIGVDLKTVMSWERGRTLKGKETRSYPSFDQLVKLTGVLEFRFPAQELWRMIHREQALERFENDVPLYGAAPTKGEVLDVLAYVKRSIPQQVQKDKRGEYKDLTLYSLRESQIFARILEKIQVPGVTKNNELNMWQWIWRIDMRHLDEFKDAVAELERSLIQNGRPTYWEASIDPAAMSQPPAKGGIDLGAQKMQLNVGKEGAGVQMNIDPVMIERFKREGIDSLTPVIFRITPIPNIWTLTGLEPPAREQKLTLNR